MSSVQHKTLKGVGRFYQQTFVDTYSKWAAAKPKVNHPQTNDICERLHKTILQEFYKVAFRKKIYRTIEELQVDLDLWITYGNHDRTHQGKACYGRTPMQTMLDAMELWNEKVDHLN